MSTLSRPQALTPIFTHARKNQSLTIFNTYPLRPWSLTPSYSNAHTPTLTHSRSPALETRCPYYLTSSYAHSLAHSRPWSITPLYFNAHTISPNFTPIHPSPPALTPTTHPIQVHGRHCNQVFLCYDHAVANTCCKETTNKQNEKDILPPFVFL